jgi:ketosteroid isomerase-like protein
MHRQAKSRIELAGGIVNKKNFVVILSLVLLIGQLGVAKTAPVSKSDDEVKASLEVTRVLGAQVNAWNNHDLEAFMAGYWKSPELTFFSGATERHGWQETMDRYKATYQSPGHEMGKLDFSDLRVETLGGDAAFVRGAWHLTMSDGKTPHGLFTLVFRKFPDGWKIVHDHTSVE